MRERSLTRDYVSRADAFLTAAEGLISRVLPWRQPPPTRGRPPNVPLAQLLDQTARLGFADMEIARALEREGVKPVGPGSDDVSLAERFKSARTGQAAAAQLLI